MADITPQEVAELSASRARLLHIPPPAYPAPLTPTRKEMNKAIIAVAAMLAGCTPPPEPIQTDATSNPTIPVEYLFTYDGVSMYRVVYRGTPIYFTAPSGATQWNESCGKGCTRQRRVEGRAPKKQAGVQP